MKSILTYLSDQDDIIEKIDSIKKAFKEEKEKTFFDRIKDFNTKHDDQILRSGDITSSSPEPTDARLERWKKIKPLIDRAKQTKHMPFEFGRDVIGRSIARMYKLHPIYVVKNAMKDD